MANKPSHDVIIQAPPIQELKKKQSCLKRSCFSSCGCLAIVFLLFFGFVQLLSRPKPTIHTEVPETIASFFPIYDRDAITSITVLTSKQQGRLLQFATVIPKVILSPILLLSDQYTQRTSTTTPRLTYDDIITLSQEQIHTYPDIVTITWEELPADPTFIFEYYQTELRKKNIAFTIGTSKPQLYTLHFEFSSGRGVLTIKDRPTSTGTDYMTVSFELISSSYSYGN
jgi:hypothetical protein